jgi:hypothetical protein
MMYLRLLKGCTVVVAVILLVGLQSLLLGQAPTGNIVGRVTDSTGAVVPGADVTAVDPARNFTIHATTDEGGMYRFLYLDAAAYNLTFKASGFGTLERTELQLRPSDTLTIDVELSVGTRAETVQVTGETPLLEVATATTGTMISNMQMEALPLQQRFQWAALYILPGVLNETGKTFHIDGERARGIGYALDGVTGVDPITQGIATTSAISTTQAAIEEVKVTTTVLPAQYGHSAGGMQSATYKAGTNQLHGDAMGNYVDNAMLHRAYFVLQKASTPFNMNLDEGMLSGPVYFGKLYNGKNRTFFLSGFSRYAETQSRWGLLDVPSAQMLAGNFSFNGLGYPIYDPKTMTNASGSWTATPFPNNTIPQNRFDPVAVKFLSYNPWVTPNSPGYVDKLGPHQNYSGFWDYGRSFKREDEKIDQNFGANNRMFARWSRQMDLSNNTTGTLNWALIDSARYPSDGAIANIVAADTNVFRPTLLNEFRVGVTRRKYAQTPGGLNANWAQTLGIPGVNGAQFPAFTGSLYGVGGCTSAAPVTCTSGLYGAGGPGSINYQVSENFTLQDNVTWIRSAHTVKAGYELIRTLGNTFSSGTPSGSYTFGGTSEPFVPNTGNDFASFLLGSVTQATFGIPLADWQPRWWDHAFFVQDDWRASPKLTLNLGLRWSYESPYQTKYGQQSEFNPTATDPLTGLPGAIVHQSGPMTRKDLRNFQPRIGAAYEISKKLAFRAGFAMNTPDVFTTGTGQNMEEYTTSTSIQQPSGNPTPAFYLSQGPGPVSFQILANGTSPFVGVNYTSRGATWLDPGLRSPYVMNWNTTFQYQLASSWLVEASYQGSAGVKLLNSWNINAIPPNVSTNVAVLTAMYQNSQPYKPFPQFGTINLWSNFGHSTYHSATLKVEKRLSSGITLTSFYTRSKSMDNASVDGAASGVTYFDRSLEKAPSNYDVANHSTTYVTWELPFGQGRQFIHSGIRERILGGWNLRWIQTFMSGKPVTFTLAGSPYMYVPTVSMRPDQILPNDQVIVQNYHVGGNRFNTSLENPMWNINGFANPAQFTLGTLGRNTIYGQGVNWAQASLGKSFRFGEKYILELRYDANNVFKTASLANPSSTVNLSNPGTFAKPVAEFAEWCCLGGSFSGYAAINFKF